MKWVRKEREGRDNDQKSLMEIVALEDAFGSGQILLDQLHM